MYNELFSHYLFIYIMKPKKNTYSHQQHNQSPPISKSHYPSIKKRKLPSPILELSEPNSTSLDANTTAHTILPFDVFAYILIKRKSYAFQLLKQFILFSDNSGSDLLYSFQTDNSPFQQKPNPQQTEKQLHNLVSLIKRVNQKLLLHAYDKIKKRYFKKKMVYRNRQYVDRIVQKITNLVKYQHHQVMQYVFLGLVQNTKQNHLKDIFLNNRTQELKVVPEQIQYEDKLFKTKEYLPFHTDEQSGIMKDDSQSFFESDSRIRIARDFDLRKSKNGYMETPLKSPEFLKQDMRTRHKSKSTSRQVSKQVIYIVGSGRKYSLSRQAGSAVPHPNRHIKIPIQSNNVDIVRIQGFEGQKRQKKVQEKKRREDYMVKKVSSTSKYVEQKDCSKCEYCVKIQLNQELMRKMRINRMG